MNHYIFLTTEGYTFQPSPDDELTEIDNLQVIGFAQAANADEAYKQLLLENPYLKETNFENIFCYQLAANYEQNRKDYNLHTG